MFGIKLPFVTEVVVVVKLWEEENDAYIIALSVWRTRVEGAVIAVRRVLHQR